MDDLVIGALQEGGIDADHRQNSLTGQTGCKGHSVLLGHAHIKEALRVGVGKELQTGAVLHGCSNGADLLVGGSLFVQDIAEHIREGFLRGYFRVGNAVHKVELRNTVEVAGVALGGGISLALFRNDVQEMGAGLLVDAPQDLLDFLFVIPIKGAVIVEAHILEHGGVVQSAAHQGFSATDRHFQRRADHRHPIKEAAHIFLGIKVAVGRAQTLQITGQRTDVFGNGHLVVVQDDQQIVQPTDVVHSLIDHAAGKGTVADDGDDLPRLSAQLFGPRDADGNGQCRVAMAGNKGVVLALVRVREAGQTVQLAQFCKTFAAAGQQLMGIALVAHVEYDLILRRRKDAVQRNR